MFVGYDSEILRGGTGIHERRHEDRFRDGAHAVRSDHAHAEGVHLAGVQLRNGRAQVRGVQTGPFRQLVSRQTIIDPVRPAGLAIFRRGPRQFHRCAHFFQQDDVLVVQFDGGQGSAARAGHYDSFGALERFPECAHLK